jgi:hypothetical protein
MRDTTPVAGTSTAMTRTDKDRPGWVRDYFDGQIWHDHRAGRCQLATLDDLKTHMQRWQDDPAPYTCAAQLPRGYYFGTAPRAFANGLYAIPMRRMAREALHAALREYNAGYRAGDEAHPNLEDRWEPPLLPDNNADWMWQ